MLQWSRREGPCNEQVYLAVFQLRKNLFHFIFRNQRRNRREKHFRLLFLVCLYIKCSTQKSAENQKLASTIMRTATLQSKEHSQKRTSWSQLVLPLHRITQKYLQRILGRQVPLHCNSICSGDLEEQPSLKSHLKKKVFNYSPML